MKHHWIQDALRIRRVEETFLDLFAQGKLNGTVHTCIGQEFSALAFAGRLSTGDALVSNHRCHGHYLAFTKDIYGLMAELMGKKTGVCGGVGSSQHLCRDGFYSNGIQGGTLPVAAGLAMARKLKGTGHIATVFLGDGTLGQGVVYETMNMASKWELPLLMVCEHNRYAQSTPTATTIAGDIAARAEAFGIMTFHSSTDDPETLLAHAGNSVGLVRETGQPVFHIVDTHRLAPHSKGDDDRPEEELNTCRQDDPLCRFQLEEPDAYAALLDEVDAEIQDVLTRIHDDAELSLNEYIVSGEKNPKRQWIPLEPSSSRQSDLLHECLAIRMASDPQTILMGEDVAAPYGGAFKITRDLSEKYPDRVIATPISEAGITGIANGLALGGLHPILEIMFGDFVTLALDQLINHASKFRHMYNHQVDCPLVLRTPMGGGRGYGPTHSQSLDKFLAGIDNVTLCALNSLVDPATIYDQVFAQPNPVVVLEHKLDYGRRVASRSIPGHVMEQTDAGWPVARVRPRSSRPNLTIVTYGGMTDTVLTCLETLFMEHGIKAEVIIPSRLCPLDITPILESVTATGRLVTIEEGSGFSGIGSEIVSQVVETANFPVKARRIAAAPVPIPSVRNLEDQILPTHSSIIQTISEFMS
ncbi:thiamine pyrophosphate-dependent enzyme [Pseudodesulfovibrio sp.]|nr:thiamine pyrophosphate-dependent enzyme [Pseudodesulfovibrio sp.]